MSKKRRGKFITFEGPEKSGKSTQATLLSRYLSDLGYETVFLREPGSTKIGEKIRALLLDKKNIQMSHCTEMLLYMAARAQLMGEVITPALKRGCIVLCDRFQDSTIAYQGFGCGLDIPAIEDVGRFVTAGIKPDLTFLLDFWASQRNLRNHKTPDRIELRPDAFHARVKRGYFILAKKEPKRIRVIRVADDLNETQRRIRGIVEQCLLKTSPAKRAPSHS